MPRSTCSFAMLRALSVLSGLFCLVVARGQLPEDFQVDLIFPQPNATYAPTQWFPIVFGIQNAQNLWPLPFRLSARIVDVGAPLEEAQIWQMINFALDGSEIAAAAETTPGNLLFHIHTVNMTNATTSRFHLEWYYPFDDRCFKNETETIQNMTDSLPPRAPLLWDIWIPDTYHHWIRHEADFSTAPDGLLPDIEAAAEECQDYDNTTTEAVRITDVISRRGICPFFETGLPGSNCNYRSVASELAANVSSILLGAMWCEEGDWRTIKEPCPEKDVAGLRAQTTAWGFLISIVLALALWW